jgi:hypothetical protein
VVSFATLLWLLWSPYGSSYQQKDTYAMHFRHVIRHARAAPCRCSECHKVLQPEDPHVTCAPRAEPSGQQHGSLNQRSPSQSAGPEKAASPSAAMPALLARSDAHDGAAAQRAPLAQTDGMAGVLHAEGVKHVLQCSAGASSAAAVQTQADADAGSVPDDATAAEPDRQVTPEPALPHSFDTFHSPTPVRGVALQQLAVPLPPGARFANASASSCSAFVPCLCNYAWALCMGMGIMNWHYLSASSPSVIDALLCKRYPTHAVRSPTKAPAGVGEYADLEDDDVELEVPIAPQPARVREVCDPLRIDPLVQRQRLLVFDPATGQDVPSWVTCPKAGGSGACVLQKHREREVFVIDVLSMRILFVPCYKCRTHDSSFSLTRPDVFSQLLQLKLTIIPALVVMTSQTVITCMAYQCAPSQRVCACVTCTCRMLVMVIQHVVSQHE